MISVHQEVCRHLHRTLQLVEHHGMKPGVVINPGTPVDTLIEVLPMVHHVLVMSVNPGFGGQKFLPFSLEKMAYLAELRHEMQLNFRIEVDGGVAGEGLLQQDPQLQPCERGPQTEMPAARTERLMLGVAQHIKTVRILIHTLIPV